MERRWALYQKATKPTEKVIVCFEYKYFAIASLCYLILCEIFNKAACWSLSSSFSIYGQKCEYP